MKGLDEVRAFTWLPAALCCAVLLGQVGCASAPVAPVTSSDEDWRPLLGACPGMPPLQALSTLPAAIQLEVIADLQEGRAVHLEIRVVKGIGNSRAHREAVYAIEQVMGPSRCPGVRKLRTDALVGPQQAGFRNLKVVR